MPSDPKTSTRTFKTARQLETSQPAPKQKKPSKIRVNKSVIKKPTKNISALIIVILVVISGFLFLQYRSAQNKLQGPARDNAKYEKQLKSIVFLPTNEKPSIATVKDATKLKNQVFFKDAKNGDKVFVYKSLKKAILYRPSMKMIINAQPIGPTN